MPVLRQWRIKAAGWSSLWLMVKGTAVHTSSPCIVPHFHLGIVKLVNKHSMVGLSQKCRWKSPSGAGGWSEEPCRPHLSQTCWLCRGPGVGRWWFRGWRKQDAQITFLPQRLGHKDLLSWSVWGWGSWWRNTACLQLGIQDVWTLIRKYFKPDTISGLVVVFWNACARSL